MISLNYLNIITFDFILSSVCMFNFCSWTMLWKCISRSMFLDAHFYSLFFIVYHMQEDGWIKVCKEDVSELIHRYRKGMFWFQISLCTDATTAIAQYPMQLEIKLNFHKNADTVKLYFFLNHKLNYCGHWSWEQCRPKYQNFFRKWFD